MRPVKELKKLEYSSHKRLHRLGKMANDVSHSLPNRKHEAGLSYVTIWLEDVLFQYFLDKKGDLIDNLSTH